MTKVSEITSRAIADMIEYYKPAGGKIDQMEADVAEISRQVALKAGKTYVDEQDTLKADKSDVEIKLASKANQSDLNQTDDNVNATNLRVDALVINSGDANAEVTDAHVSTVKNKNFTTVRNRLEDIESDAYFPIRNYILNGNFSQGTSGWAVLGGTSTISAINNVMSIVGNGTSTLAGAFKETTIPNVLGKKIYLKVLAKVTNADSTKIRLRLGGTTSGSIDIEKITPISNELYLISGVVELTSAIVGSLRVSVMHLYSTAEMSNAKTMEIKYVVAIDLSATYGTGQEPSKEYMDKIINQFTDSYFEGITNAFKGSSVLPTIKDMENSRIPIVAWNDESVEKTVTINTTNHNFLIIEVPKIIDTKIEAKILGFEKSVYVNALITNMQSGVNQKYILTRGYYQIDVSNVSSVQLTSVISSVGYNTILKYWFDRLPRIPYQTPPNPNNTFKPATLIRSVPNIIAQAVSKGIIYASTANILTTSSDWGVTFTNKFTFAAGVTIKRVVALDNGNILVLLNNGQLQLSKDNGLTFTVVMTMTSAKLPHDLFGITYYKNIVLLAPYATIPSGDPGKELYMSVDNGETFNLIFSLLDYGDITQSFTHIHSATYDPYENMIWVCTGDGSSAQMIFYSKDMGVTWSRATKQGNLENQSTVVIPLRNCVLFTSDARLTGVLRYIRPTGGTQEGVELYFDYPLLVAEKWGKDLATEVPIASTAAIDWDKSEAYFSWACVSSSFNGRVNDALNHGEIYTTDGFEIKLAYKRETVTRQSSYGIYGDLANDKKIVAKLVDVGYFCDVIDVSSVWSKS